MLTWFGPIEDTRVPRLDQGGLEFTVLNRYEHRRRDVDAAFGRLFLKGVSTRKLKGLARELFGKEVSTQTVSSTLSCLDQELEGYKSKPLADTVEFLFLDGISQKVREIGIEKKVVLCALGIHRQEPGEDQPRKEALKRVKTWEARWLVEEERAVKCMKKDLFNCLHFYDFPPELWKSIRTTNILERAFREVRRRTRPMNNFFTNEASSDRIMYGISQMLNKNWRGKSLNPISII